MANTTLSSPTRILDNSNKSMTLNAAGTVDVDLFQFTGRIKIFSVNIFNLDYTVAAALAFQIQLRARDTSGDNVAVNTNFNAAASLNGVPKGFIFNQFGSTAYTLTAPATDNGVVINSPTQNQFFWNDLSASTVLGVNSFISLRIIGGGGADFTATYDVVIEYVPLVAGTTVIPV